MTETENDPAEPKKSETLEVRIPYETKQAFLTACREDGTTASEVVRDSVQTYLDERERPIPQEKRTLIMKLPQPVRRYGLRVVAGGAIAAGLDRASPCCPARPRRTSRRQFKTSRRQRRWRADGRGIRRSQDQ